MYDSDEINIVLNSAKNLKDYLKGGVTTIRDAGGIRNIVPKIRQAVEEGIFEGPDIICCGQYITMTGGHVHESGRQAEGEIELKKAVREQLAQNVDYIKIMGTWGCMEDGIEPGTPQYTEEEFRVVVEEAARHGRKVAAHIGGTKAAIDSINAGVHSLEHGILFEEEAIDLMAEKGVWYIPTLTPPYRMFHDVAQGFPQWMVDKMENLMNLHFNAFRLAVQKGAKIATGTDAGTPFTPHGDLRFELKLMVKEGMTPKHAIQAATINGAECLGIADNYGTVSIGKKANLIILEKNPLDNIESLDTLRYVIKNGKVVIDNTK